MNRKEQHNPITKYFEAQKFVDYCEANRVDASLNVLETYEKHGILIPIYCRVFPDEFIKAKYEYEKKNPLDPVMKLNCPSEWEPIVRLINALSDYNFKLIGPFISPDGSESFAYQEGIIKNGHPLDNEYKKHNPFLKTPNKSDFRPWKDYEIVVDIDKDGDPVKRNTAEHYYALWQIFIVDDLNYLHTIKENYLTKEQKGRGIVKKNIRESRILEFSDLFQTISNFRMLESIIRIIVTDDVKGSVIEGECYRTLEERTKKIAEKEYAKHNKSEWMKFLRKLVELYYHYTELEKDRLSQELKRFLGSTAIMVMMARNKDLDFERLCNEYGEGNKSWGIRYIDGIRIYYKGLEKIFPIEINQLRERALSILPSYIKEVNDWLPKGSTKLPDNFHEQLVSTIIDEGNELLLTHLYEIEDLWFKYKLCRVGSIWAHLRFLAIGIEELGKEWFCKEKIENIFIEAFGNDYRNRLKSEYNKLKPEQYAKSSITRADTQDEFIEKLNCILGNKDLFNNLSNNPLCKYHLVVTHLTRNFVSHHIKIKSIMMGSLFVEVYRCLVLTLVSLFAQKKKTEKMREKVKFGS